MSEITAPLNRARVSEMEYAKEMANIVSEIRRAFELMKQAIAHTPLLCWADLNRPMHLAIDASTVGVGGVLYQPTLEQQKRGDTSLTEENIVSLCSRSLSPSERNYIPFKLKCLAVVYCVQKFHQFLWGRHFTIHTDHQALVALKDHSKRQRTLGSWLVTLLEYDVDICHTAANKVSYRITSRAFMNALASGAGY